MVNELRLKVAEAVQDDVNKGIVRIDSGFMKELGISPGEIVEIESGRKTVNIADRAYPGDMGLNIIRMDGDTRKNAKTSVGELVTIRKAKVEAAKKVDIAPAQKGVMIRASPQVFKQALLGRAVVKGDIVSLGGPTKRRMYVGGSPIEEKMFSMIEESLSMNFGFSNLKFMVVNSNPAKGPVLINEETVIEFNPEAVEVKEDMIVTVNYEDVGGLKDEIKKVREMVELPLKHPEIFEKLGIEAPKGVLLHGPPGTGKTLLAKAVASETNSHFILINGPEIMSKFYGESEQNLRKKFEEAEKNAPAIIFIDEIDAIATKREETRGEVERRVVAQLLGLMDGLKSRGKVVVIAATNMPNMLDPALRRPGRFDREIEIGVPTREGRLDILKIHTRNMPLDKDVKLKEFADITHGFVGADLSALAKEAAMVVLRRVLPDLKLDEANPIPKEVLEKLRVTQADFREALKVVRPSAMREVLVEVPNVSWDDIGGLEDVKKELAEAIEWPLKQPKVFERLGIRPPKGVLLYGAPGTGKTLMAKAVAKQSESNFILVNGPSLLSKWVGESEKAVREIFRKARQTAPTIIFFDEIDSLAPHRHGESSDSGATERVVNQMLTEMDGLEGLQDVVVIAATNRPDLVDRGLLRPGRFDRIILCPVPDEATREKIFEVHTKSMPLVNKKDVEDSPKTREKGEKFSKEDIVNIKDLAKRTENYVGADIEAVCREAAMFALRDDIKAKKVTMKQFEKALEKVKASMTEEIEDVYEEIKDTLKRPQAKEMKQRADYFG